MKADIILRNAKKRGNSIAVKIRVTRDDGSKADYACIGHAELPSLGYECHKYQQGRWVKDGEKNTEVLQLVRSAFSDFCKESSSLYKRQMKDSKGVYHIMYKDSYIEEDSFEITPTYEDWHMKVADSYVVVKQNFNDSTKQYEYTYLKRNFGKPNEALVEFNPNNDEHNRIIDMVLLGDRIRRARRDEYSRNQAMIRNITSRPYQTHTQKTFSSCSNRERSLKN